MADLAKFHQTKRKFMDLTILANFSQIPQRKISLVELTIVLNFNQIHQSQVSLADFTVLMHFFQFCYCIHFWTYLPNFTLHILNTVSYLAFSIASRLLPVHSQFVMYPWLQSIRLMFGLHNARKWGLNSPTYVFPSRVMSRLISEPYKNKDIVLNNLKRIGRN